MNRRNFVLMTGALFVGATSAARAARVDKSAELLKNGEFNWFPERSPSGPVLIIVSIPDQLVHVYRNGIRIAASTCSTGMAGHATPTGVFKILQKDKDHHSSTYNDAPMPNMNRLTWSGIALHAGNLPGYPASHGCVRLPKEFSALLFGITRLGMTVVIADNSSQPADVVHPGMVLGDYARREFAAVDAAVTRHGYAEAHEPTPVSTSVVISAADRKLVIWENGEVVASGPIEIASPDQPLGEHVYMLTRLNDSSDQLTWVSADLSPSGRSTDALATLKRIKATGEIMKELGRRMRQGMTLFTTDKPASKTTAATDFTVMTGLY